MSQSKILAQLQLKKNHKGTFYADIEVDGQKLCAYLSNKVIEGGQLYTSPLEDNYYWASINLSNGSAFINQLLPLPQCNEESSELEYHCYCQRLEDGSIHLITEQSNNHIVLPKQTLSDFAYRIFHNSQVVVRFEHDHKGFSIKELQTKYPSDIDKGELISITKKSTNPKAPYIAKYKIAQDTYLPVEIWSSLLEGEGIYNVDEKVRISATLTLDDQRKKANISLMLDHKALVEKYNQPKATLTYLGEDTNANGGITHEFKTEFVEGICLSVSIWPSQLHYFSKEVLPFKNGQSISAILTGKQGKKRYYFNLLNATDKEYQQRFRCIEMKQVDYVDKALFEAIESPYVRVLVDRSELVKKGIYAIHSGVEFALHIKREEQKNHWQIKDIDKGLFIVIDSDKAYKAHCKVVNTWSRYDDRPNYVMKIERSQRNYAFKNHAMASVRSEYVDLALIIPKALLIARGFRTLDISEKLSVVFKEIIFPVFTIEANRILCADDLQDSEENQGGVGAGENVIVLAEYIKKIDNIDKNSPHKTMPEYSFSIINSDDSAIFTDWEHQMSQVDEPGKYRYKVRIEATKWGIKVKELISASIK